MPDADPNPEQLERARIAGRIMLARLSEEERLADSRDDELTDLRIRVARLELYGRFALALSMGLLAAGMIGFAAWLAWFISLAAK